MCMSFVSVCCSSGVFCLSAVWRQQPGVLHDLEQELHNELVKEQLLQPVCGTQQGLTKEMHPKFSLKHAHKCEHHSLSFFLSCSLTLKHLYSKDKKKQHTRTHIEHSKTHNTHKQNSFQPTLLKMQFRLRPHDNILLGIIMENLLMNF